MEDTLFTKRSSGRYRLLFAALLSIALMFVDSRFKTWTDPVRYQLNGLFAPVYEVMSWPGRASEWIVEAGMSGETVREENRYLKSQLLVLSGRLQKFSELAAENARLRGLIDSTVVVDGRVMIAEIVGVDPDPFRHIVMVNKGEPEGIYVGQAVLDARGIMGQVIEVGPQTARVMLIADREHALPVRISRNGVRAIVAGNGDIGQLTLQYVPESADVKVGDLLLSSGLGLRYPAGYPVGVITRVNRNSGSEFADISARPAAELDRSRHVLMLFSRPAKPMAPASAPAIDQPRPVIEQPRPASNGGGNGPTP